MKNIRIQHPFNMKWFFIFFGAILPATVFSQLIELTGAYGASFIGGERIEFRGLDSFYFNGFYCTEGASGRGVCEIKDGYLYLYFSRETKESKPKLPVNEVVKEGTPGTFSTITFNIFEADKITPAPFVSIFTKQGKTGTSADANGNGQLKPAQWPATIVVSGVGYETREVKIAEPGNYHVKMYLSRSDFPNEILSDGQVHQYELGEVHEDWFEARPAKTGGAFRIYRRKPDH